ncbi:hypothetical protein [uncultured Shimia sp.]|uniref:hypothetical protein n=1 Tax=uncultured Shimia sp. TaxID=573152 RepID=UPI0026130FCF|nr:hypothetical protein [uncultured Shimia sp.]
MPTDLFSSELSADFKAQLHLLRTKYFDSLEKKEMELKDIIAKTSTCGLDTTTLTDLYTIVHNLAGIAPTHGFRDVGKHASAIEKAISEFLPPSEAVVSELNILSELKDLTKEIRATLETCRST